MGRCVIDRGDDPDHAIFHRNFQTQPAEFPMGVDVHLTKGFRIKIDRVRIKTVQHPLYGIVQQLTVIDVFYIVRLYLPEDLGEDLEVFNRQLHRIFSLSGMRYPQRT